MEKKREDYLHLYLGCEGIAETIMQFKTKLVGCNPSVDLKEGIGINEAERYKFKPFLRPLSSITEDEDILDEICVAIGVEPHLFYQGYADLLVILYNGNYEGTSLYISANEMAEIIRILCKYGVDLFGLIESGLAIDKTTLS